MNTTSQHSIWARFWSLAGRVPLRQKIIGIIVAPLIILGFTIAWWVSSQLGGWLSFLLSEERVAQAMAVGMRSVVIITLFSAVVGLLIGSFLTWVLTRPILAMTYVARRVKNGSLAVRAPVWANDEIGELGRAFNDMILSLSNSQEELKQSNEQLRRQNRELDALYKLADMTNHPANVQQVSVQALHQAVESVEASAGLILLLGEAQPTILASDKLSDRFLDKVQRAVPDLKFLVEPEAEFNELKIIDQIAGSTELPAELIVECQRYEFTCIVHANISGKQSRIGGILLFYQDGHAITQVRRQLISGICNQVGVTILNSQLWEELKHKESLRAQLLNKVVTAQEEERRRISRELHDETGQALTSLLVQLKILEQSDDPESIQRQVNDIRQLALRTLQEVRRLAMDLRPAALDDLGLISALEGYIYNYSGKTGLEVTFEPVNLENTRLPHDIETVLYRVIQESLTNIARHANASQASVRIMREHDTIHILVEDNGRGFDASAMLKSDDDAGLGILGMQERIELIGGRFKLHSRPGQGTRIAVELTIPQELAWMES